MADELSAALVLRVWLEPADTGLRARLSWASTTPGDPGTEPTVATAASVEKTLDALRDFLVAFTADRSAHASGLPVDTVTGRVKNRQRDAGAARPPVTSEGSGC